jgi:hypothetical protein
LLKRKQLRKEIRMKLTDAVIKNINHKDKDQFFSMQGTEGLTLVVYRYPSTSKT